MLPLPDGRVFLRWMFLSLGLGMLFFPEFTVHSILRAPHWGALLYPGDSSAYALFVTSSYVYAVLTPLLSIATFFGLKRNKSWAHWTGAAASTLLLCGFPVLTPAGAVGLYAMFAKPRPPDSQSFPAPARQARAASDLWIAGRDSKAQPFISGITMIFGFQGLAWLTLYAQRNNMPAWNPGWTWWVFFFFFLLVESALHELGHAAMAWTVYFRVRTVEIGPLTFWKDGYGYQVRWEWKRLLDSNGYMRAAPASEDELLFKQISVVAGGPLLSLVAGGLLLLAFLALPGTGWESAWWIVAFNAVLGLCYGIMSLLPFGCSDGVMLYHLLRDTPAGRQLMGRLKAPLVQEQAADAHSRADFHKEVEYREMALQAAEEDAEGGSMTIALSHLAVAYARLALEDWLGAQAGFLKCLEFEAECGANPRLKSNAWAGLQTACLERYWVSEAARAGAAAVKVIEERKPDRNRVALAVTRTVLAQVHVRAGAYQAALAEAGAALAILPPNRGHHMLRATIFSVRAQAHLYLGDAGPGLAAAREAAGILSSPGIPAAERNLAFHELGELGEELWKTGQSGGAIDLMRQAVTQLESGGSVVAGAQHRIHLAAALRTLGRHAEALYTLPEEETLPPGARRSLLAERAGIHLAAGRHGDAVADARALVALWHSEPQPPAPEIAAAEGLLARACLEAGNPAEAEPLARQAATVLAAWGHPDAAACLITLALATRQRHRAVFDEALRLIESHPLLSAAEKARRLEAERARLDRFGPIEGSITVESPQPAACD